MVIGDVFLTTEFRDVTADYDSNFRQSSSSPVFVHARPPHGWTQHKPAMCLTTIAALYISQYALWRYSCYTQFYPDGRS